MKTIELHGILAKKFGRFFKLEVNSAQEAAHALACQIPAFRAFMLDSERLGYRFAIFNGKKRSKANNISETQISDTTTAEHIHIVPRVIANLAIIFHWTPADCADMDIDELMDWHELAMSRWQATQGN